MKAGTGGGGAGGGGGKKPRTGKPALAQGNPASADDAVSIGDHAKETPFGFSQSWLFGGKHNGPKAQGSGRACKILDMTEKVLLAYDSLHHKLQKADEFMSLTFKKVPRFFVLSSLSQ